MRVAAALLLGAARAGAAEPGREALLKEADALSGRADAAMAELRALTTGDRCPAGYSAETLLRGFADKSFAQTADALPDAAKADVRLRYACLALAAGRADACADLKVFNGSYEYDLAGNRGGRVARTALDPAEAEKIKADSTFEARCVARYKRERMVQALIARDPDAVPRCLAYAADRKEFRPEAAGQACRVLASRPADRDAACRTLSPLFIEPVTLPFCRQLLSELYGDEAACAGVFGGHFPKHVCEQFAAYRKALEAKSKSCEGGLCRMWLGGGAKACEAYGAAFKTAACGRLVAPAAAEAKQKELAALVEGASRSLNAAEDLAEFHRSPEAADALDARAEHLARLARDGKTALDDARAAAGD